MSTIISFLFPIFILFYFSGSFYPFPFGSWVAHFFFQLKLTSESAIHDPSFPPSDPHPAIHSFSLYSVPYALIYYHRAHSFLSCHFRSLIRILSIILSIDPYRSL
ncbi:hypothetical protein BO82DRAFT_119711 [Aspergillus uvarum CBS 121591]|uniref:Uncharacterized protein n=1 Tax=Aspergillus uvarum CBS 121591 TaxID=1448315 RepID=A0A319CMU5_9EURO|nr:hypothetical protein BO82DRAFT_119711 [Aspergillus uvarum CBS 121591]PYH80023.1 hypothetical protein BO82DRAFT_119711 [Aspergillus uvarum CBS 121591]